MPVLFRIDGAPNPPARVNLMPAGGGSFYLYLNELVRRASDTKVGDLVQVEVEFDPTYRGGPIHPLPRALARGLREDSQAMDNWQNLPPSRQKEIVRYLAGLKGDEARAENIRKALDVLRGRKLRFLGRTWNDPPTEPPKKRNLSNPP